MMRRFVNSKYHETLYFVLTIIFMAGCRIWWTYSQMAIGSTLIALDIVMQLDLSRQEIRKEIRKNFKYSDSFIYAGISTVVFLSLECSNGERCIILK